MSILVTGGAGYIGSHTVVQLLNAGFDVVVLDNLCNSNKIVFDRIKTITGKSVTFIQGDVRSRTDLQMLFQHHSINAVMHFAGLKAVGESEANPLRYYDNNVVGSLILFEEMVKANINTLVFSSSATVYSDPSTVKYHENTPLEPINVYGRTKLIIENILFDLKKTQPEWSIAILRCFNPVGAHESGLIGENASGKPNNLMPYIAQVAVGKRDELLIFGDDYPTPDGTGLRDYIHVDDLVAGHLAAFNALKTESSIITVNLGTGRPYSVFDVIKAFEKASGKQISFEVVARRAGDLAEYYADPSLAKQLFGWQAQHDITRMCQDTWRWQSNNPEGYK
jgi:UDP-glucose 4-epimerase